jgi:farnesyl-diphosphate farnesyltransferase
LQLVNILRDLPGDLRQGRCYLPSDRLTSAGLRPADLLEPANEPRLRPVYDGCLAVCEEHLRAGWAYTNAWPFRHLRLRLACALPLLLGAETARLLHRVNVLDPKSVRKVPRSQLKGMVVRLVAFYPFPGRWKRLLP